MAKQYRLIRVDNDKQEFEGKITEALNDGWTILGNPSISFHKEEHQGEARLIEAYLISMIKESDE